MKINNFTKRLICWGGADQAIVLRPIIRSLGSDYDLIVDDTPGKASPFSDVPLVKGKEGLENWLKGRSAEGVGFIIAIGNPYGFQRQYLHNYLISKALQPVTLCDASALIDNSVIIDDGAQIMKGVILNAHAVVNKQCILNTGSLIEHHCHLGEGVEIGPGGVLCGRVHVGDYSWVGAGATVLPRINIGTNTIIGAGAVVTKDACAQKVLVGVPAKEIKQNPYQKEIPND